MNEASEKQRVRADALRLYNVPSARFVEGGWPDDCFFIPGGRPLLIEMKFNDNDPSALQDRRYWELRALGYDAVTCWSYAEAMDLIRNRVKI